MWKSALPAGASSSGTDRKVWSWLRRRWLWHEIFGSRVVADGLESSSGDRQRLSGRGGSAWVAVWRVTRRDDRCRRWSVDAMRALPALGCSWVARGSEGRVSGCRSRCAGGSAGRLSTCSEPVGEQGVSLGSSLARLDGLVRLRLHRGYLRTCQGGTEGPLQGCDSALEGVPEVSLERLEEPTPYGTSGTEVS